MSYSKLTPSLYKTNRSINNQLINCAVNCHDLCCGCETPTKHLGIILLKASNPESFTKQEKEEIQQCLGTTTEENITEDDPGFGEGELERLFSEENTTNTDG